MIIRALAAGPVAQLGSDHRMRPAPPGRRGAPAEDQVSARAHQWNHISGPTLMFAEDIPAMPLVRRGREREGEDRTGQEGKGWGGEGANGGRRGCEVHAMAFQGSLSEGGIEDLTCPGACFTLQGTTPVAELGLNSASEGWKRCKRCRGSSSCIAFLSLRVMYHIKVPRSALNGLGKDRLQGDDQISKKRGRQRKEDSVEQVPIMDIIRVHLLRYFRSRRD
eukprot:745897-Hanusia_phi.AAC.2